MLKGAIVDGKMCKSVKPLKVSPVIKSARYILFFSGILYGITKLGAYRTYELTAKPKRDKMLKEKYERKKAEELALSREELVDVVKQMDLPDVTPGWENDVY